MPRRRNQTMDVRTIVRGLAAPTFLILLGTGCGESLSEPLVGPETAPSMSRVSADAGHPFRLSGRATLIAQNLAPGFPDEASDFDGRCSVPSHFTISFSVIAEATHLGRLEGHFEHCSQIDFETGGPVLSDGMATLTAANGDELELRYRTADDPVGDFDELIVFDGGTGRFQAATGQALGNSVCDRAAGTCMLEAHGTLVYDASDRRGG